MARAREETRGHPLGRFVERRARVGSAHCAAPAPFTVDIVVEGRRQQVRALALLVTNNRFAADWRRPRLDEGVLELHLVEDEGALTKLKASAALLTGAWRDERRPQHRGERHHHHEPAPAHVRLDRRRTRARAPSVALSLASCARSTVLSVDAGSRRLRFSLT